MADDTDYLQHRAEEELEMAQRAGSPEATVVHYKLANAYLERIEAVNRSAEDEEDRSGAADGPNAAAASTESRRRSAKRGEP